MNAPLHGDSQRNSTFETTLGVASHGLGTYGRGRRSSLLHGKPMDASASGSRRRLNPKRYRDHGSALVVTVTTDELTTVCGVHWRSSVNGVGARRLDRTVWGETSLEVGATI